MYEDITNSVELLNIHFKSSSVKLFLNDDQIDIGTVTVAESALLWHGETKNFAIPYKCIGIHAVSTDKRNFPYDHLLMMLNDFSIDSEQNIENDEDEEKDEPLVRFVLSTEEDLKDMYASLNECQALNPDSDAYSDSEEEDEDGVMNGGSYDPDQFEDA